MSQQISNGPENDDNNNSSSTPAPPNQISSSPKSSRWQTGGVLHSHQAERHIPKFIFDPDSSLVCYWTAAVAVATLYNAWTIALRIAFPEIRETEGLFCLYYLDMSSDFLYAMDILMQLRTAYLQDGIPVFESDKIRHHYMSQTYFLQDVISVLPSQTILSILPDAVGCCKYFLCTAGAARLTKLLKFHIIYKFYDIAESFTSNPHLIRVLRLFLNLAIIIHWIACLYYLLSEYEGLGSNEWVYTKDPNQQNFTRKYIVCLYWSAMTLTTIGNTNSPETDMEYIFTGVIFMTGVFVFATVMGNVGDVISSMNANRQEFQARMDHIQMYLTHKKVPASLQLKIKKWAEYTWSRTKATDESRLLNMLPERLRAEVAVHVHLDSLKKVKIFEQCETGFLCELVLKLRSQVFSPGDYVCRVGETGREMFIINHGKVEVLVPSPATNKDMVVAVLSEGNYFGEISLLRLDGVQNRRTADVRSIGYSELLCLSRRDLMAALVEYPEAKSILEGQAKKRMKTNLQAQRAFSVDTLLRSSQEYSSTDSGILGKDDIRGHDVSEIKAMIEELKNANKAPGKTVWQLITRCEILQAKLGEKEKEVEDSKQRIKDLEQLLFSRFSSKSHEFEEETYDDCKNSAISLRPNSKVIKQFSQDDSRPIAESSSSDSGISQDFSKPKSIPDVKITRPLSEDSDEETESRNFLLRGGSNIRTSKIVSIPKPKTESDNKGPKFGTNADLKTFSTVQQITVVKSGQSEETIKIHPENVCRSQLCADTFAEEYSENQEVFLSSDDMSFTASFKDIGATNDRYSLNVQTIPEESEDEEQFRDDKLMHNGTDTQSNVPSPNSIYRDLSPSDQEIRPKRRPLPSSCQSSGSEFKHIRSSLEEMNFNSLENDMDFLRAGSRSRSYSDDSTSRRSSWNWESDAEGESDIDDMFN